MGDGDLMIPLTIQAVAFSASAKEKIEKAGGTLVEVPVKKTWTKALGKELKAAKEAAGPAPKTPKAPKTKA